MIIFRLFEFVGILCSALQHSKFSVISRYIIVYRLQVVVSGFVVTVTREGVVTM